MATIDAGLPRHDRYFRYAFSTPEAGRDLVAAAVPEQLLGDFHVLSVESGGLDSVDERPREDRLDLLVTIVAEDGRTVLVYFLFEHKSRPEPKVLFQLYRYVGEVWKRCIAGHTVDADGKVPGIIPVVSITVRGAGTPRPTFAERFNFSRAPGPSSNDFPTCSTICIGYPNARSGERRGPAPRSLR